MIQQGHYHRKEMFKLPADRLDGTMASSPENENALVQRNASGLQRIVIRTKLLFKFIAMWMWPQFAFFLSPFNNAYEWYQREADFANSLLVFVGLSIMVMIFIYQLNKFFILFAIRAVHSIFKFCLPVTSSWNCIVKHLRKIVLATGKHGGASETSIIRNGLDSAVAESECENLEDVRTDGNDWPERVEMANEASSGNQYQLGVGMSSTLTFSEKMVLIPFGANPASSKGGLTNEAEDSYSSKSSINYCSLTPSSKQENNASAEPLVPGVATDRKKVAAEPSETTSIDRTELSLTTGCHPSDSTTSRTPDKSQLCLPSTDLQNLGSWATPAVAVSILVMKSAIVIYLIRYNRDVIIMLNLLNVILGLYFYPWIRRKVAIKLASLREWVSILRRPWLAGRILWAESKLLASGYGPPFHVSQNLVFADLLFSFFIIIVSIVFLTKSPVLVAINALDFCYKLAMLVYHVFPLVEYKKVTAEYCRLNYWLPFKSKVRVIWKILLETWLDWAYIQSMIAYPFRNDVREFVLVPTEQNDRERNYNVVWPV
ncbi:Hypothetical predicted protein [Cloeon dipterum]|uniref:Uncharacterized protein n=1 Tax=Cloeon dipterum TaxID=197152 RepID=A0A8S1DIM3_9INSE|nr:Hypothetical predicted protein [Cloeon dipterum]